MTRELFRHEALEAHRLWRETGEVVRLMPAWSNLGYLLIAIISIGLLVALGAFSVSEYAAGPGYLQDEGLAAVVAPRDGIINQVLVTPGDSVLAGVSLARYKDESGLAETASLRDAYESLLLESQPYDETIAAGLYDLRVRLAKSAAESDGQEIQAANSGRISDVWVEPGAQVKAGQPIATMRIAPPRWVIVGMVSRGSRRLPRPGMRLLFAVNGNPARPILATLKSVSEARVVPDVLRGVSRHADPALMGMTTPALVVKSAPVAESRAHSTSATAVSGLTGIVNVRVGAAPLAQVLLGRSIP